MTARRKKTFVALSLLALAAALWAGVRLWRGVPPSAPARAEAHLRVLAAPVWVQPSETQPGVAGEQNAALYVGCVVKTDEQGEAQLVFAGNNVVHLGHNGSLLIERGGASGSEVGVAVLTGQISAQAGGQGLGLSIRSPVGRARLPATSVSVLEVSIERGLQVKVGEVALQAPQSEHAVTLQMGQIVTVASAGEAGGIVIDSFVRPTELAGLDLEAHSEPFAEVEPGAQWQKRGTETWQSAEQPTPLAGGDSVQGQGERSVRVQLANKASVHLHGGARLQLQRAKRQGQDVQEVQYALPQGSARIVGERPTTPFAQVISLQGSAVRAEAGAQQADIAIEQSGEQADVIVRFGQLTLPSGEVVHAGQAVHLQSKHAPSSVREAFVGAVPIGQEHNSVIYYQTAPPPVRFVAPATKSAQVVRFGADPQLRRHVHAERLFGGTLSTDAIEPGRTYFRVGSKASIHAVDVIAEPNRVARLPDAAIDLDDTGEPCDIIYENAPPPLSLHWAPMEQADRYVVSVHRQSEPKKAFVEQSTRQTELVLPADALGEGDYLWQVVALNKKGKRIDEGQQNAIALRYEARVQGLRLRAPLGDLRTKAPSLVLQGDVETGCSLQINGELVPLNKKGGFVRQVPLRLGVNHFVFCLSKKNRPDRYYVRKITREG